MHAPAWKLHGAQRLNDYVSVQGCSCDNQLLNLLPMVGAQASQIQFGETPHFEPLLLHARIGSFVQRV